MAKRKIVAIIAIELVVIVSIVLFLTNMAQNEVRQHTEATELSHQQTQTEQAGISLTATDEAVWATRRAVQATANAQYSHDIQATATSIAYVTATARAVGFNPYQPDQDSLTYINKMDGSDGSWDTNRVCIFDGGAYHVLSGSTSAITFCGLLDSQHFYKKFKNFTIEFNMRFVLDGNGGVLFRGTDTGEYMISFDQNGYFRLWSESNDTNYTHVERKILSEGYCSGFRQGIGQENTIGLVVQDSHIAWFANRQAAGSLTDTTISNEGAISFTAYKPGVYVLGATEVAYSDFKMWNQD